MAKKKDEKIKKYPRPGGINVGIIVFFILILYIAILIFSSITKAKVSVTEVESGKIIDSSIFTGIAIRDEEVINSDCSGFLNYYINDGARVAKDENVCMVDTLGTYTSNALADGQIEFSDKDYDDMEQLISVYMNAYTNSKFSDIYTFKYNLQNKITEIISNQVISSAQKDIQSNGVQTMAAPYSGIVSYSYDGMENLTLDDITDDMFNYATYKKNQLTSSNKIDKGMPAYKLTKDSQWSVVIKVNQAQAAILADKGVIQVKFTKDDITTWAYVNIFYHGDSAYAELQISRYMVRYINDRYIELELITAEEEGLKIPTSAVVTKDFYTIPEEYLVTEENTNESGFYKYTYTADNELKMEFVKPTIYKTENGLCYVDLSEFSLGDYIGDGVSHDGQYRIGATDSVSGVYNINQGYTIFRIINILYQNDDYCIVERNTAYGIVLYDRIVLNADAVDEEQIIY